MSILTADQEKRAISWLNDFFILLGLKEDNRPSESYGGYIHNLAEESLTDLRAKAVSIYQEIINRNFSDITKVLDLFGNPTFPSLRRVGKTLSSTGPLKADYFVPSSSMIARYLAWMCKKSGIYWDDLKVDPEVREAFISTPFGQAIADFRLFSSQNIKGASKARKTASASSGSGPKIPYKDSGPHSTDITILVGKPHEKLNLVNEPIFITGPITGKNIPSIYITPARPKADGSIRPLDIAEAGKTKFGSANGYTDCTCFFDDVASAMAFMEKASKKFPAIALSLGKVKKDTNGYFKVITEFGPCYIKASRLNEDILKKENIDIMEGTVQENLMGKDLEFEALKSQIESWNKNQSNYITDSNTYFDNLSSRDN